MLFSKPLKILRKFIDLLNLVLSIHISEPLTSTATQTRYCFSKNFRDKNYRPTCTVDLIKLGLYDKRRLRDRHSLAKPECVCEQLSSDLSDIVIKLNKCIDDSTERINDDEIISFTSENQRSNADEKQLGMKFATPICSTDTTVTITGTRCIRYCFGSSSNTRSSIGIEVYTTDMNREIEVNRSFILLLCPLFSNILH